MNTINTNETTNQQDVILLNVIEEDSTSLDMMCHTLGCA